jgi:hypothetical protein
MFDVALSILDAPLLMCLYCSPKPKVVEYSQRHPMAISYPLQNPKWTTAVAVTIVALMDSCTTLTPRLLLSMITPLSHLTEVPTA